MKIVYRLFVLVALLLVSQIDSITILYALSNRDFVRLGEVHADGTWTYKTELTSLEGVSFPSDMSDLRAHNVQSLFGVTLPAKVDTFSSHSLRTLEGTDLPTGLRLLFVHRVKSLKGIPLQSLWGLSAPSVTSLEGALLPDTMLSLIVPSVTTFSGVKIPLAGTLKADSVTTLEGVPLSPHLTSLSVASVLTLKGVDLPAPLQKLLVKDDSVIAGVKLPVCTRVFTDRMEFSGSGQPGYPQCKKLGSKWTRR